MNAEKNIPFVTLVKKRNRVRYTLTAAVVIVHAFFVGGIAFYRDWFAQPLYPNATITMGIAITASVIITMIVLECIYIYISGKYLDPMRAHVTEEYLKNK